jgi:hypothetical protein
MASQDNDTVFSHSGLHFIEVHGPLAPDFHEYMHENAGGFIPMESMCEEHAWFALTYEQLGIALKWLEENGAACTKSLSTVLGLSEEERLVLVNALMHDDYAAHQDVLASLTERGYLRKYISPMANRTHTLNQKGVVTAKLIVKAETGD